jgi:uncharacterized protein (TIGR02231 family)
MGRKPPLLLALLLPALVIANDITPVSNTVEQVTVYLDRAEVTRRLEVTLPAGEHTILVSGLPAQLFEASLRATGQGKGLRIATVESRRAFAADVAQQRERELRAQLQAQQDEKARLEGRGKALETQARFIERLAALPSAEGDQGQRQFVPEKWPAAWAAIGKGMAETNAAKVALQQELRTVEEAIRKLEQELRQIQTGRRDSITAAIQVQAESAGKARFDLSYQLGGASWSPIYDAELDTGNGKLALTQAATIRQATGEDWREAQLTVSTARPGAGAAMPELNPWWLDFYRLPVPLSSRLRESKVEMADEMLAGAMAPQAEPMAAEELVATGQVSEFSVRYRIPGRVTVPADNSQHRFVLAKQDLDASMSARTAPKLDQRAFLYADVDYRGDAPLLPGEWRLQRDGVFVGSVNRPALLPGDELALAFGADDAIEVEYKLLRDERGRQGLIKREQRIERQYRIALTNRHQVAMPVTVFDQIPVSRDETIKVELLDGTTAPTELNVENRPGVLAWKRELKAQQGLTIDFGYAVSFPQDREVPGF